MNTKSGYLIDDVVIVEMSVSMLVKFVFSWQRLDSDNKRLSSLGRGSTWRTH
jgi:hypothetical protein